MFLLIGRHCALRDVLPMPRLGRVDQNPGLSDAATNGVGKPGIRSLSCARGPVTPRKSPRMLPVLGQDKSFGAPQT